MASTSESAVVPGAGNPPPPHHRRHAPPPPPVAGSSSTWKVHSDACEVRTVISAQPSTVSARVRTHGSGSADVAAVPPTQKVEMATPSRRGHSRLSVRSVMTPPGNTDGSTLKVRTSGSSGVAGGASTVSRVPRIW